MQAGFLEGSQGPLFHVRHKPSAPVRGHILYVHPFAEELNKSRRMAALQARRFAQHGWHVVQPDLYGCGDSGGDFGDADWRTWRDDLERCVDALLPDDGLPRLLMGLRGGCLLIGDLLAARPDACAGVIFWQPSVNGETLLNQFLRLRLAAGMMNGQRESTGGLRERLAQGETVEVAGYVLGPGLAAGLAAARLEPPPGIPVHWLEVTQGEMTEPGPASARTIAAWRDAGCAVDARVVRGEPFWSTQEIREVPALIEQTLACAGQMA